MGLTIDGNNITFTGIDLSIVNGFDPNTGVAYLMLTSSGGWGSLPFMSTGESGLSPTLNFSTEEIEPDDPMPDPNPEVVLTSAGGAGERSIYDIKLYIRKGAQGVAGTFSILDADDISGSLTDEYVLAKKTGTSQVYFVPQRVGSQYVPAAISSTSGNSTGRLLATVSIPAQPFDWRPRVFGQCVVSGGADTRVDLVARVGHETDGHQVGYAYGIAGATPPPLSLIPAAPTGSEVPGSYGRIAAGATTMIYLRAEQKAPTSASWSTSNTTTTFWVEVQPLLPISLGS